MADWRQEIKQQIIKDTKNCSEQEIFEGSFKIAYVSIIILALILVGFATVPKLTIFLLLIVGAVFRLTYLIDSRVNKWKKEAKDNEVSN